MPIDLYLEHHHHVVCEQMSQGLTCMHVYHAKREPQSTSCLPTMRHRHEHYMQADACITVCAYDAWLHGYLLRGLSRQARRRLHGYPGLPAQVYRSTVEVRQSTTAQGIAFRHYM